MHDIRDTVNGWLALGKPVVLATVVETWGSAPRAVGAKMAISAEMTIAGSVSGGCVEATVISEALDALKDGQPRLLHFGVSDETAWDVGLACGGHIRVFVDRLDEAWWTVLGGAADAQQWLKTLVVVDGENAGAKVALAGGEVVYADARLSEADVLALAAESQRTNSGLETLGEHTVMVDVLQPSAHLIIVGGGHTSVALNQFARLLGMRVSLIDPRQAFATPDRFPDAAIYHQYPNKALASIPVDRGTSFAILTHDPKIDDPALIAALNGEAGYIGVLGSRRTHAQRLERLRGHGFDDAALARLHAPIGLSIGARTPEQIALAIMAEIVAVQNGALSS